jgi:hypothetical protein
LRWKDDGHDANRDEHSDEQSHHDARMQEDQQDKQRPRIAMGLWVPHASRSILERDEFGVGMGRLDAHAT